MTAYTDIGWVSVNGRASPRSQASLPVDHGLLRADGCFETALVLGRDVVALSHHLGRLRDSLDVLKVVAAGSIEARIETLQQELGVLLALSPEGNERVLRISVTADLTLLELSPLPDRVKERRRGLHLFTLDEPRSDTRLARHKTLAWSVHAIASRLHPNASEPCFEGLWLSADGHLLEGTATNVFVLFDDGVHTPPLSRPLLPGTARARAIAALRGRGVPVHEVDVAAESLGTSHGVFVTSALVLATAALSLDRVALPPPPRELIDMLGQALRDYRVDGAG